MTKEEIFKNINDPLFDASQFDWDTYVGLASEIVETEEMYQKVLGKIASSVGSKYGEKKMHQLSTSIEQTTGLRIDPSRLRAYRWVYEKLVPIIDQIPLEWNYTTWRALAGTENPASWVNDGIIAGWSGRELVREIKISKGEKPVKDKICPNCGYLLNESKNKKTKG